MFNCKIFKLQLLMPRFLSEIYLLIFIGDYLYLRGQTPSYLYLRVYGDRPHLIYTYGDRPHLIYGDRLLYTNRDRPLFYYGDMLRPTRWWPSQILLQIGKGTDPSIFIRPSQITLHISILVREQTPHFSDGDRLFYCRQTSSSLHLPSLEKSKKIL